MEREKTPQLQCERGFIFCVTLYLYETAMTPELPVDRSVLNSGPGLLDFYILAQQFVCILTNFLRHSLGEIGKDGSRSE